MKRSHSRPIIELTRERRIRPSRLKRILYLTALLVLSLGVYILFQQHRPKKATAPLPKSYKPPLIDRSLMERLGMYDEPEPIDEEWMGPLAFRSLNPGNIPWTGPLLVTALPDLKPPKHKYISNALADWKLCGFRDRPCRVILVCPAHNSVGGLLTVSDPARVDWRTRIQSPISSSAK
jgi:hypothetical protein